MSIRTQGSVLSIGTGSGTPETFNAVGELTSFQILDGEAKTIDITTLDSTAIEKWIGLPDEGSFTADLNCNFGDVGQTAMRAARAAGTKKNFKLVIPAGPAGTPVGASASGITTITFAGYVKSFRVTGQKDSILAVQAKVEITGPATISVAA